VIKSTSQPEAVLLVNREKGGNLLITGDCLCHQTENAFINVPTMARFKMAGLLNDHVVVSPLWLQAMTVPDRGAESVHTSLENMSRANFHRFISTSGNVMVKQDAKKCISDAIQRAFQ